MEIRALALATSAAVALSFAAAPAAWAAPPPPDPTLGATACLLSNIGTPAADACVGWYNGNLIAGSPTAIHGQVYALNALLGTSLTDADLTFVETLPSIPGGSSIDFSALLYGDTVIGVHVGGAVGAGGIGYDGTAFFKFDAGTTGLDVITFNLPGLSNARLYSTGTACTGPDCGGGGEGGVPEPATWAMMILGFGGVGATMRRRRATLA